MQVHCQLFISYSGVQNLYSYYVNLDTVHWSPPDPVPFPPKKKVDIYQYPGGQYTI